MSNDDDDDDDDQRSYARRPSLILLSQELEQASKQERKEGEHKCGAGKEKKTSPGPREQREHTNHTQTRTRKRGCFATASNSCLHICAAAEAVVVVGHVQGICR